MNQEKIEQFLLINKKYLPVDKFNYIREKLAGADEQKLYALYNVDFKDPTAMVMISSALGVLGVDRFILGETGLGALKLLTCGGCGIWALADIVMIIDKTKEYNFNQLAKIL